MMCVMAPPHDAVALKRLASAVTQRRVDLGFNKIDVARAAGLQINTYSKIEDAKSVRHTTYGKIEPVLDWAPGSCVDILNGATTGTVVTKADGIAISPVHPDDLAKDVGSAVQDALIAVSDDLNAAQIRELKQRVVDEVLERWKQRGIDRN